MIWWHGKSSDDFRVIVERYPSFNIPARKQEKISVPGRNGDLVLQQNAFENIKQRYEVFISAERPKIPTISHLVAEWLCVPGYQKLEDSYWLDSYYLAVFSGGMEVENIFNRFGRCTIEFDCKPQRFLKSGERVVEMSVSGKTLVNEYAFDALPLITVYGTGSGTLTVGSDTLSLSGISEYITLDSDVQNAYKGVLNQNSKMTGEFPKLRSGENLIAWTGDITGVSIIPRWWTL